MAPLLRLHVAVVVLSLAATGADGAGAPTGRDANQIETVFRTIPFELVSGYLVVVRGSIGRSEGLNLVIDTGTGRTVIDERLAAGLTSSRSRTLMEVFGDTVISQTLVVPSLSLGPVRLNDLPVIVADLRPQQHRFGRRIDALVGMDVLAEGCLTVDYVARRLTVDCLPPSTPAVPFRGLLPVVDVFIDGHRYRLLIDSGSEVIAVFETALPKNGSIRTDGTVAAVHLTGTIRLERYTARQVRVGAHSIGGRPMFIIGNAQPVAGYDGVLAARSLTETRLHVNVRDGFVSWQRID